LDWGITKHEIRQGSMCGPLLPLAHINDLPPTINTQSKPILFANDCFQNYMNVFASLNKWIKANKLTINFDKTNSIIQYIIPKLSSARFGMRTVTSLMKTETLKLVYFYFHSIMLHMNHFWEKFNEQQRSIMHPKETHQNNCRCYHLRSLILFH
jgi:hypothetical protein